AWAAEGVINGAVRADRQTKGRGRAGRSWISEGGNFYASWLTKPNLEMAEWPGFSLAASLAVCKTIEAQSSTQLTLTLKWPNDLLLDQQKLAGILLETVPETRQLIIGIGINLAHAPKDNQLTKGQSWSATALADYGVVSSAASLFKPLGQALDQMMGLWATDPDELLQQWQKYGPTYDEKLTLHDGTSRFQGRYQGLDRDGALRIIHEPSNEMRILHMADIIQS
ncbi:MAG: biotin--[acetyl-CoA-carboxylase] ligase, partial [Pseudomonadota bacterium]